MFAAFVALTLTAPAAEPQKEKDLPEAAKKDLKKLEGKWKAVKLVVNDEERENPMLDGEEVVLEFKGRKIAIAGKDYLDITELDPTTSPKLIDFKGLEDKGGIRKDTVYEGIYKVDGETLTIALYVGAGNKRPEKFESPKESNIILVTLKREKN
jgi:uncharacterized protein (TIGR03067 family)